MLKRAAENAGARRSLDDKSATTTNSNSQNGSSRMFWLLVCSAGVVVVFGVLFGRKCRKTTRKYAS